MLREIGSNLLRAFPRMIEGGLVAVATPNRAMGGPSDIAGAILNSREHLRALDEQVAAKAKAHVDETAAKARQAEADRKSGIIWDLDRQQKEEALKREQNPDPWRIVGGGMGNTKDGTFKMPPPTPQKMVKIPRDVAVAAGVALPKPPPVAANGTEDIASGAVDATPDDYVDVPESVADNALEIYRKSQQPPTVPAGSVPRPVAMAELLPVVGKARNIKPDANGKYMVPLTDERHHIDAYNSTKGGKGGKPKEVPTLSTGEADAIEANKNRDFEIIGEKYDTHDWPSTQDLNDSRAESLAKIRKDLEAEATEWDKAQRNYEGTIGKKLKTTMSGVNIRAKVKQRRVKMLLDAGKIDAKAAADLGYGRAVARPSAAAATTPAAPTTANKRKVYNPATGLIE